MLIKFTGLTLVLILLKQLAREKRKRLWRLSARWVPVLYGHGVMFSRLQWMLQNSDCYTVLFLPTQDSGAWEPRDGNRRTPLILLLTTYYEKFASYPHSVGHVSKPRVTEGSYFIASVIDSIKRKLVYYLWDNFLPTNSDANKCPTIQFNSDSIWMCLRPTILRAQSHKTPVTSNASSTFRVPRLPTFMSNLTPKSGIPTTPLLRFDNLLDQRTELR